MVFYYLLRQTAPAASHALAPIPSLCFPQPCAVLAWLGFWLAIALICLEPLHSALLVVPRSFCLSASATPHFIRSLRSQAGGFRLKQWLPLFLRSALAFSGTRPTNRRLLFGRYAPRQVGGSVCLNTLCGLRF